MKKILLTLFNHERYQSISIIIVIILLLGWWGCEPKSNSIRNPKLKVTRSQLKSELDSIMLEVQNSVNEMDRQEEVINFLFQQALVVGSTGTINPIGILTSIGAILGLGATVDNVRKRKVIKTLEKSDP